MSDKFDFSKITESLGEVMAGELFGIVEGAQEDIQKFGIGIAQSAVLIMQRPEGADRDALLAEVHAQARLLAEQNRIRANNASWKVVESVVSTAIGATLAVLTGLKSTDS